MQLRQSERKEKLKLKLAYKDVQVRAKLIVPYYLLKRIN